ncbi:MAG: hypothetical protein HYV61_08715 [Candidatus Rokubacteria bacterium]|nr:hypothetical protein [Candidatus Rokubacteria bacterium]
MKPVDLKSGLTATLSASIASLCCLLPLVVVALGLGSGAFMAVTMRYTSIFIPVGLLGTGLGYYLYFRERRRSARLGCPMGGRRANRALLAASTLVLGVAVALTAMPDYTARLIASFGGQVSVEEMAGMGASSPTGATAPQARGSASVAEGGAPGAIASVTLRVDGMT